MQIFVINLNRHAQRWRHMQDLLRGLDFKRITAVDGKTIDGPEQRVYSRPTSYEILSRYERGCILSHRSAWREFLESGKPHCCVLEDDVFLSPDFAQFIRSDSWLPKDCDLMKIETVQLEIFISDPRVRCLNRTAALLESLHLGTAGYVVGRRGALALLAETVRPDRPLDMILFNGVGRRKLHSVYQLLPALCIQAKRRAGGIIFPELESSIQPQAKWQPQPSIIPAPKTLVNKMQRELFRPFRQSKYQMNRFVTPAVIFILDWFKGVRRYKVPFA